VAPTRKRTLAVSWCVDSLYVSLTQLTHVTKSALKSTSGKPKKEKKKAKKAGWDDEADSTPAPDAAAGEDGEAAPSKAPVEVTAEDLADEEWGPVKEKKGKKGKKGKKAAKEEADEDEDKPAGTF
jgi:translation initiation factor 5B